MEIIKHLKKALTFFDLYRFGAVICLIWFVYQSIDLTLIYFQYDTVVELKVISPAQEIPSISVCEPYVLKYQEMERNMNESLGDIIFGDIICEIQVSGKDTGHECSDAKHLMESLTPNGVRCLTYFSKILNKTKPFRNKFIINFMFINGFFPTLTIHQTRTHHFFLEIFSN